MDTTIGNYIASGGAAGAVVMCFYITYKLCIKKKCRSKCWGAELDVRSENSPDLNTTKKEVLVV
jgi:hypothetical protein